MSDEFEELCRLLSVAYLAAALAPWCRVVDYLSRLPDLPRGIKPLLRRKEIVEDAELRPPLECRN